jgi:hypothetical protein
MQTFTEIMLHENLEKKYVWIVYLLHKKLDVLILS